VFLQVGSFITGLICGFIISLCMVTLAAGWLDEMNPKKRAIWVSILALGIPGIWIVVWIITGGPS
jgi:hypothetical protein